MSKSEVSSRRYYIRSDNIYLPENLMGLQAIDANTVSELMQKVYERYNFSEVAKGRVQLWSANTGVKRIRLDTLEEIPKEYEILWMKGVPVD
jgi:hypothetical protein